MKSRLSLGAILLFISTLTACTTNPVTGESQFTLISPQQEVSLGAKQYGPNQQSQGGRYTVDPDLTVYVNQVGQKLAAKSDRRDLPYEFVVLNNDVPNAWALPGGKIAINRGLLVHLKDEAQLAAVLSHEIVHAAARHGAQQMTQNVLLQVGSQVAVVASSQSEYGQLIGTGAQLGSAMYEARYGREQELEADHYGMNYMARAGYDPRAAIELQETFVRLSAGRQTNWLEGLFASHPPSIQRVEANREHAAQLPSGVRNEAAFKRATKQLTLDKPAYDLYQQALKAASDNDFELAQKRLQQAINKQPNEPLFFTTMGQLELQQKNYQAAINQFDKAHKLYPEYYLPLLGRGIAAKQLKSYQRAEQDLIDSNRLLPTQAAVFYLGEIKLSQGNKSEAVAYFQQAAQGGGALGEKSQAYLQELNPPVNAPSSGS